MESTSSAPTACQCASRKFPIQLVCDLANAVMDTNGELLQYLHLMARPEYWVVWGKSYAKEFGILNQVLPGVVKGTYTFDFVTKHVVPFEHHRYVTYG